MVHSQLLIIFYVIFDVSTTMYTNAFQIYEASCCAYTNQQWVNCCKQNMTSLCCGTCDSVTNGNGLSNTCSYFNTSDINKIASFIPTGQSVNFNIIAFQRECSGRVCSRTRTACTLDCYCCNGYSGEDPGFKISTWAPNDESSKYSKYLNCTLPPQWVPTNGSYFFSCIFTGWGMASGEKTIKLLLNSNTWTKLQNNVPPLTLDVHFVAGNISIPYCQYQWERSNSFISKEFGILKIILYDGYGNKVSGATGGHEFNSSLFNTIFQRHGHEEILNSDAPITAKVTPQVAFGVCIVTIYSTEVGTYMITVTDDQNNKVKGMPAVFYVLPDKAAKDALYKNDQLLPDTKTYFKGDEWMNDFNENEAAPPMNLKIKTILYLNICTIIYIWIVSCANFYIQFFFWTMNFRNVKIIFEYKTKTSYLIDIIVKSSYKNDGFCC